MVVDRHKELTQKYSTWGDKLFQHADVFAKFQRCGDLTPITVQLSPTEQCSSDCPFCSVAGRPVKNYMPWPVIENTLEQFASLGAKSVEITGGGEPLLYRDKEHGRDINSIIALADQLGLDVGIITNTSDIKRIDPWSYGLISWLRISLIKLDEGVAPESYNFRGFPEDKLGFSYIIYEPTDKTPRWGKQSDGTTVESLKKLAKMVELYPGCKFVRIAGNCLIKGSNATLKKEWQDSIDAVDPDGKFFIKDIGEDDGPFDDACYVGALRPYVASAPDGSGYRVYICTSHVLNTRTYDLDYSLCAANASGDVIMQKWEEMAQSQAAIDRPYEVKCNGGVGWEKTCKFCYYKNNNRVAHMFMQKTPDPNFA